MPDYIDPQLCTLVDKVPRGDEWVHEIKLDGYRIQAKTLGVNTVLRSRKGLDWTHRFPEIANACNDLPDCIIDGEICAIDEHGMPSFSSLQNALSTKRTGKLVFFVFDLLFLGREDYRPYALETRKKVLAGLLNDLGESRIRYHEHHNSHGATMFKSACELKLEGIVSKRIDATYLSGRAGQWTKTKCRPRQELVIGGWETNNGAFSSLLLGAYRGGKFHYVGTAGTGFNSKNLPPLMDKLRMLINKKSPFEVNSPKPSSSRFFVKKKIVCEVAFETWTRSGKIRQASFKGLREDKDQSEVIVEEMNYV
jgi:bifunctional non-homologous end joining protein LigD